MTLRLDHVPDVAEAPANAAPTRMRSKPNNWRAGRRMVLRGIMLGAATIGTTVASFGERFTRPAWAEEGPGGLQGHDLKPNCEGSMGDHDPDPSNDGQVAACVGGYYIKKAYCNAQGWFKTGSEPVGGFSRVYYPVTGFCRGKNAWQWKTGDEVFRCSDGFSAVYPMVSGFEDPEPVGEFLQICQFPVRQE